MGAERTFWRSLAVFAAASALLFAAYARLGPDLLRPYVIDAATVAPAARLIQWLDPGSGVRAAGAALAWPGARLSVLNGCDGVDALILLLAAFAAAPLGLRARLSGMALGAALVWSLNQLRLVALYWAFRTRSDWFEALHVVIGPLVLIGAAGLFFVAWTSRGRIGRPPALDGAPA